MELRNRKVKRVRALNRGKAMEKHGTKTCTELEVRRKKKYWSERGKRGANLAFASFRLSVLPSIPVFFVVKNNL